MAGARPTHEACAHGASSIYGYQTHTTRAFPASRAHMALAPSGATSVMSIEFLDKESNDFLDMESMEFLDSF